MKYIVYCRKSRDEIDKQVLSIEAQIAELKEFAKKENLEIVEFIEEAKTAKVPGREKFAEVIKKLEKGQAQGILAWHPDRLARNSMDGGKIVYLLDTGKLLDLKFPTFWFDNTPQGKFMLSIAFGQSKYYIDNLSENVRRGQRQKLRNGVWPAKAPYGYSNNFKTRGIDVDPEKSKAIKKAYQMFAEGNKTFIEIGRFLYKFGLTRKNGKVLHTDEIHQILTNKFYIGIMKYKDEYYEGTHECFISKELFKKVQEERQKRLKQSYNSHRFPFVGLMKCAECGASITAEQHIKFYKTKNRKVRYVYYHCTKKLKPCNQQATTEFEIESQFKDIIKSVSLPYQWANKWVKWIKDDEVAEKQNLDVKLQELKTETTSLDQKLNILLDSYLDQVIDSETYKQKKNEIFENKLKLQEEITKIGQGSITWLEPFKDFIEKAKTGAKIARAKNNCEEVALFAKNIGLNFFLDKRKLTAICKPEYEFLRAPASARGNISLDSLCVGVLGFEPRASASQTRRSTN